MTFERWIQSRLTSHGYPCGVIDGKIGPITTAALMQFERDNELFPDGLADERVVKALRASASAVSPNVMSHLPDRDNEEPKGNVIPLNAWPRQKDLTTFYGRRGTNQTAIILPFPMKLAWKKQQLITKMTLNKRCAESASRCFQRISEVYNEKARLELGIDIFSGSLNVRKMRGSNRWSTHSWGCAIDFDNQRNGLHWHKPKARLSHDDARPFWEIWEAEGWLSLGRARNFDWMHVQAARL